MAKKKHKNPALSNERPTWGLIEKLVLWSKCAGRCELCNQLLYENKYTKDIVNLGNLAHIIAHSNNGPRPDDTLPQEYKSSIVNIILLCNDCHTTVDTLEKKYTVAVLRSIKKSHEDKIRFQTAPTLDGKRRIFLFTASIAGQAPIIDINEARDAMFPEQYAADENIILGVQSPFQSELQNGFWDNAKRQIDLEFNRSIYQDLRHCPKIGVFAIAPMPLLIYLGWKIGDKYDCQVFQRHRHQDNPWKWPSASENEKHFDIIAPTNEQLASATSQSVVRLAISVSFDIRPRIQKYHASSDLLWEIRAWEEMSTEYVSSPTQLAEFRKAVHTVLNDISQQCGRRPIHLYLSVPVSLAVTLGMSILPKATSEIIIHDYVKTEDKDVEAITINFNDGI